MRITISITVTTLLCRVLGALLLWAAISKLANPTAYALPLPDMLLRLGAMALPWAELLGGLLLLADLWRDAALAAALGLLVLFAAATGQAWARGLDISCGCFDLRLVGLGAQAAFLDSVRFAFVRNLALLAAAAYAFVDTLRRERVIPT